VVFRPNVPASGGGQLSDVFLVANRTHSPGPAHANPGFLAVHVVADKREPPPAGTVEIVHANGRRVRVGVAFNPHILAPVVELLEDGGQSC